MKINVDALNRLILDSPYIEASVTQSKQETFAIAKAELLRKFREHIVTQEILAGPNSENISGTLGGRGNLFTFIGFPVNSDPIGHVEGLLEEGIQLIKFRKRLAPKGAAFDFNILTPESEIREDTPLPYEAGNSWVYGIEEGIDGFSHYIFTRLAQKASRSERGVQNVLANLGGDFSPVPYITPLLEELKEKINAV